MFPYTDNLESHLKQKLQSSLAKTADLGRVM